MLLRMRAVDIVEDAGFTALEAINADDALAVLESRSDIELLFTDIQMPGSMDESADTARRRPPQQRQRMALLQGQIDIEQDLAGAVKGAHSLGAQQVGHAGSRPFSEIS